MSRLKNLLRVAGVSTETTQQAPVQACKAVAQHLHTAQQSSLTFELDAIQTWLAFIGENDPAIIADVLGTCHTDSEARAYFIARSSEVPP